MYETTLEALRVERETYFVHVCQSHACLRTLFQPLPYQYFLKFNKTYCFFDWTSFRPSNFNSWIPIICSSWPFANVWNSSRIGLTHHFASTRALFCPLKGDPYTIYKTSSTLLGHHFWTPWEHLEHQNHFIRVFGPLGFPRTTQSSLKSWLDVTIRCMDLTIGVSRRPIHYGRGAGGVGHYIRWLLRTLTGGWPR